MTKVTRNKTWSWYGQDSLDIKFDLNINDNNRFDRDPFVEVTTTVYGDEIKTIKIKESTLKEAVRLIDQARQEETVRSA